MIYIILAIVASTSIIVMLKIFSRLQINIYYAILVNYVVASLFGYLGDTGNFSLSVIASKPWLLLAIGAGFLFILGFNLFALSAKYAGVALTGMASRISLIVAVAFGLLVFGDKPAWTQILGIMAGIVAFMLTFYRKGLARFDRKFVLLPLALLMVHGFSDLLMKVGQHYYITDDFNLFLATVFVSALFFGILYYPFSNERRKTITWKDVPAGIILGFVNWYSGYFLLLALNEFYVSLVIPMINISIVAATALIGFFVFREKLSKVNWIGVGLALVAIALMLV